MPSGFFAILDDIVALMDDVAVNTKIATQKTAGILGDDLAVNAEKATGFLASREIPVLWAITKGSFLNKIIIVPLVLLLNWIFPALIKIILVLGGLFLAYEGVEKVIEWFTKAAEKPANNETINIEADTTTDEKKKIKSAIQTDFILSLEIVIIALSTVANESLMKQIATVSLVAIIATIGVYGIVALIVRMDDAGYQLIKKTHNKGLLAQLGLLLIKALPWVIKLLAVLGTIALLLVSGGIFVHTIHAVEHSLAWLPYATLKEFFAGLIGGSIVVAVMLLLKKAFPNVIKGH